MLDGYDRHAVVFVVVVVVFGLLLLLLLVCLYFCLSIGMFFVKKEPNLLVTRQKKNERVAQTLIVILVKEASETS